MTARITFSGGKAIPVRVAEIQAAAQQNAARAQAEANRYGSYVSGLGNIATALGNAEGGRSASLGTAEAARQVGLGNISSAALGAFGNASNNAMAAWAANQTAYNKAASDMHSANQQGMSMLGGTRNSALSGLGSSYADMAGRIAGANAIGNLSFNMSGDGFSASGNASKSNTTGSGLGDVGDRGFGGLDSLRNSLMTNDIVNNVRATEEAGRRQLDDQHYSSRFMPSMMMGDALSGLTGLANEGYHQSATGMNQFYANSPLVNARQYQSLIDQMSMGGYSPTPYVDSSSPPPQQQAAPTRGDNMNNYYATLNASQRRDYNRSMRRD